MIVNLNYQKKYYLLYMGFLALLLLMLFVYHVKLIVFPYPLEYREGAIIQTTQILLEGKNPYSLDNQPQSSNVYGIFYHLVAYPIAKLAGANLTSHRAITGFFIISACVMVFLFALKRKSSPILSIIFISLLYASLLVNQTPLARPDSLGLFLLLLAFYIPLKFDYSNSSIFLSALIGIFAFFTKSYFLLVYPLLGSYLFLFVSKKKGLLFSLVSIIILTFVVFLVDKFLLPTYIADCLFVNMNATYYSISYVLAQTKYYIFGYAGLSLILLLTLTSVYLKNETKIKQSFISLNFFKNLISNINLTDMNKPFYLNQIYSVYYYLAAISLVLFFKMAGHHGAQMTYFYQLLSPFLILAAIELFGKEKDSFLIFFFIGFINVVLFLYKVLPHYSINDVDKDWKIINTLVAEHNNILNNPVIAPVMLDHNKKIYDNGHSEYFIFSMTPESFKIIPYFEKIDKMVIDRINSFRSEISSSVARKKFDIIMLPNGYDSGRDSFISDSLVTSNYFFSGVINAPAPHNHQNWKIEIWKPRNNK